MTITTGTTDAPIAALANDPVALAQALIRCESVTPAEGGALALLERVLGAAGFTVERVTFQEPGTPDVENLYARFGNAAPNFVFAGHTDVVPPGAVADWRHSPFAGVIAEGRLWGRGASDMKGGVAASVVAAARFLARHGATLPGSISFLITGDEEGPAVNGTPKLLGWARARGEVFDHCLLGEPTNPAKLGDMIKIGRRGSLSGTLRVEGKQGHVAYPALADNPIPKLLKLIDALKGAPLDAGTAHFDPSNLEFVTVDVGNPSTNVIPARASARFNVRFNDSWTSKTLGAELTARCEAAGVAGWTLELSPTNAEAFLTAPGPFVELVAAAVEGRTGTRPALSTTGGTSDARFIQAYCPVVEFGLVGDTMHQVDERTGVADIETLTAIYEDVLERYFAG